MKTLDEYRLDDQNAIGERQFKQLKQLHWIEDYFTLILLGPPGVGNYRKFLFIKRNKCICLI